MSESSSSVFQVPKEVEEKFWSLVEKSETCWNFTRINSHGYGYLDFNGKRTRAHRFSYSLHFGSIGNELCVLHRCDNRACVRPDHLFLGTYDDNNKDRSKKGRSANRNGENHPMHKLTEKEVLKIRSLYTGRVGDIARISISLGINYSTVTHIVKRTSWKHVL